MRPALRRAAVVLVCLLPLGGCSMLMGPDEPTRDAETGEITEASEADVFAIRVGDCLREAIGDEEVTSVPTVPCSEPHDAEVYAATELPDTADGAFPGYDELDVQAEEFCLGAFDGFVGTPFMESTLDVSWLVPSEPGWDELDDRELLCLVIDPEGGATGSLRSSQR